MSDLDSGTSLNELVGLVGGSIRGDGSIRVRGLAPVFQAEAHELGLLSDHRYLDDAPSSGAGALLVSTDLDARLAEGAPAARIVLDRPQEALPALLAHFHPPAPHSPAIHPTAVLGKGVDLGEDVSIGPYVVLGEGVRVGDRTRVEAHCVLGDGVVVGADCRLHPHVTLYPDTVLGSRVGVHSGSRVGSDGFGYVFTEGEHRRVPQVGACILEDDVEIGANVTIDRGSIGRTVIGRGTKIDNLVHIAHNVVVGPLSLIVAQVGISGSTRLGAGVVLAGQVGLVGHLKVGDGVVVAAQAGVQTDLEAGKTYFGTPSQEIGLEKRSWASYVKLPELVKRVRRLEKQMAAQAAPGPDPAADSDA
jgi:UDP-3-O-[3-hydroxymyristoyl] glucosamine N-acyltransferase